jgi:hypothetical protein
MCKRFNGDLNILIYENRTDLKNSRSGPRAPLNSGTSHLIFLIFGALQGMGRRKSAAYTLACEHFKEAHDAP